MTSGATLDAGGLIAVDRGDRRVAALLARIDETQGQVTIPATALAQVVRDPTRQVRLMRLLRQPNTTTVPLERADASFLGQLLAATGTRDIVDAHVVLCARRGRQVVITSDRADLEALDPLLTIIDA